MYIPANLWYDLRPSQKGHLLHTLFIKIVINWLIWLPVIIIERENFTARGVTHACKPASFPSFVTASKLAGKNNDWTSKDQSTWKRIVTISPYPTRSVYSWLSPKFSPEMCPSMAGRGLLVKVTTLVIVSNSACMVSKNLFICSPSLHTYIYVDTCTYEWHA